MASGWPHTVACRGWPQRPHDCSQGEKPIRRESRGIRGQSETGDGPAGKSPHTESLQQKKGNVKRIPDPKNRNRLTNGLNYLSLRAPEGCVAIQEQYGEIASFHSQ